jgi:hypothetical protein
VERLSHQEEIKTIDEAQIWQLTEEKLTPSQIL